MVSGPLGAVPAPYGKPRPGTILIARPPGSAPSWILPLAPAGHESPYAVAMFDYLSWRPLLWLVSGVTPAPDPALSLASVTWNGARTRFTVSLKRGLRWSDGTPLTSTDVLFWYDELVAALAKSPANWASYAGAVGLPDQIATVSLAGPLRIVFQLKSPVNPTWFELDELASIQPMPAHAWARISPGGPALDFTRPANARAIYDRLAAASADTAAWITSPLWRVVDGPYRLTGFNASTGGFTMAPNTSYAGPHAKDYPAIEGVPFASDAAEVAALKKGSIDQGYLPLNSLAQLGKIRAAGYRAFAYPYFGWNYVAYNFHDGTGDFAAMIGQLYLRQALAHLDDQRSYIRSALGGLGVTGYGPIPALPASSFAAPGGYAFSAARAIALLRSHGWAVRPGGTDTCASPGTGSGHCGPGIPAGTPLAFPLAYAASPAATSRLASAFAADAARAGIRITLVPVALGQLVSGYNDASAPWNQGRWAAIDFGGFTASAYPTTYGVFNSAGAVNFGGYSDGRADTLIQASIAGPDPAAAAREAAYLAVSQPGLFLPVPDQIAVWSQRLSGSRAAFEGLTQFRLNPELEYLTR